MQDDNEKKDHKARLKCLSQAMLRGVMTDHPDASPEEIRLAAGLTLASCHQSLLTMAKTKATVTQAFTACVDSFDRLAKSLKIIAEKLGHDFFVSTGAIDFKSSPKTTTTTIEELN